MSNSVKQKMIGLRNMNCYTVSNTNDMAENKDNRLAIRVRDEEKARLLEVLEDVKGRNPHMDLTKLLRELIGLDPPNFVTQQNRDYLSGKKRVIEGGGAMTNWRIPVMEPANQMDKKSKKRNSA